MSIYTNSFTASILQLTNLEILYSYIVYFIINYFIVILYIIYIIIIYMAETVDPLLTYQSDFTTNLETQFTNITDLQNIQKNYLPI